VALGAYDFHQKPVVAENLALVLERAEILHAMRAENRKLRQLDADSPLAGIVTRDPGMLRLCRKIEKVAPSSATVMLLGGSGSGKELLARALHQLGGREKHRFIAINCASIPDSLLESELFGHEKGAFTGAAERTLGKIELANGGTFFLDEIGDMPLPLQAKLLRFLQERVIERVGGRTEIPVEVRVVCATHQDLESLVQQGRFRGDLYYRLSEVVLAIPPLGERQGDAILLAHHFRERACRTERRGNLQFSEAAVAAIEHHAWPGNVRELENCVRRAVILCEGAQISPADLGLPSAEGDSGPVNLRQVRDEVEYKVMVQALARANGNIVKAAELLGVSRPTLYDLMHHHGVKP
jgi:two-component system NtrC family response regulator